MPKPATLTVRIESAHDGKILLDFFNDFLPILSRFCTSLKIDMGAKHLGTQSCRGGIGVQILEDESKLCIFYWNLKRTKFDRIPLILSPSSRFFAQK